MPSRNPGPVRRTKHNDWSWPKLKVDGKWQMKGEASRKIKVSYAWLYNSRPSQKPRGGSMERLVLPDVRHPQVGRNQYWSPSRCCPVCLCSLPHLHTTPVGALMIPLSSQYPLPSALNFLMGPYPRKHPLLVSWNVCTFHRLCIF